MKYFFCLFLLLSSCSSTAPVTLVPQRVTQTQAAFDGNDQDSGIKGYEDGRGFILSDAAVLRYTKLCEKFAEAPVGLNKSDKNYLTKEGMSLFLKLNDLNLNK